VKGLRVSFLGPVWVKAAASIIVSFYFISFLSSFFDGLRKLVVAVHVQILISFASYFFLSLSPSSQL
jgi:hypothetical protein